MRLSNFIVLALLATPAAQAAPVTYSFTGTVDQVGTTPEIPVVVGQQIPIVITVDAAYPQDPSGNSYSSLSGSLVLSATFAGQNNTGLIQTVMIDPGLLFQINTTSPQISNGFGLTLSSPLPGALPTSAIPSTLNPADFETGTFSVVEAFSASEYGFSGTIDGLASSSSAVPEPASLALLAAGLLSATLIRRRNQA